MAVKRIEQKRAIQLYILVSNRQEIILFSGGIFSNKCKMEKLLELLLMLRKLKIIVGLTSLRFLGVLGTPQFSDRSS